MSTQLFGEAWISILAFAISSVALAAFYAWSKKKPWLDIPSSRSTHIAPVPRGAGIALAIAVIPMTLLAPGKSVSLGLCLAGLTVLGALDDWRGLPVWVRLVGQAFCGFILALGASDLMGVSFLLVPVGMILVVFVTNMTNFMDGINGITGLNALVWGFAYLYLAHRLDLPSTTLLSLTLIGACIAFLPWNIPRARLFLGDSGSYLVGGMVSSMVLMVVLAGQPLAALAPILPYALDTSSSIAKRLLRGHRITQAHRMHVYQRVVDAGLSQMRASTLVATFSLTSAIIGLASIGQNLSVQILIIAGLIALNSLYLVIPRLWEQA